MPSIDLPRVVCCVFGLGAILDGLWEGVQRVMRTRKEVFYEEQVSLPVIRLRLLTSSLEVRLGPSQSWNRPPAPARIASSWRDPNPKLELGTL